MVMMKFVGKILLISTFFVGLGAIAEGIWKTVAMNEECKTKIIKLEKQNVEVMFDRPIEEKKIFILREDSEAF
jgi:hypothetical protein